MIEIQGYIGSNKRDAAKIAKALEDGPVMFSWTEGATHFDFYMVPNRYFNTMFAAPQKTQTWRRTGQVIVSIERKGCFNFGLLDGQDFKPDYVAEKLGLDHNSSTPERIAELFNLIASHFRPGRAIEV